MLVFHHNKKSMFPGTISYLHIDIYFTYQLTMLSEA